jgi:hypothetical protein
MATPVVTGIAALVKAQNSNLTNIEVVDILKRSSVVHDSLQGFVEGGRVVNANKAVLEAQRLGSQVVDVLIGDSNNSGSHDVGDAISILRHGIYIISIQVMTPYLRLTISGLWQGRPIGELSGMFLKSKSNIFDSHL